MVRFSCFNTHIHSTKPKKSVQVSAEVMHKALEQHSDNQSSGSAQSRLMVPEDDILITSNHVTGSPLLERNWESEEFKLPFQNESVVGVNKSCMRKSQSLGSGLDQKRRLSGGSDSEIDTVKGFSSERSHGGISSPISGCDKDPEATCYASLHASSGMANDESVFSIEDPQQFDQEVGQENNNTQYFGEYAGEYMNHSPHTPKVIIKSCSLPNLFASGGQSTTINRMRRTASCENLDVLIVKGKEAFVPQTIRDTEGDDDIEDYEKTGKENPVDDGSDGYNYVGSAEDWIIPVTDENTAVYNSQADTVIHHWEDLPDKDFKMKRIDVWVSAIQDCSPSEGENAFSASSDHQEDDMVAVSDGLSTSKHDSKITPGMEAAKRYVSSLSATTTAAQLANHGLVMIPFLSAFVSLKALNLSGNAIVRINAGALPRGLHILNLSKNNISTIEGLRELTRLRVLDLSYNRIIRIGHGLASCSSIKELYLAGNKISEVEGLHRLLKLNVLDLRFNKISTTKCLGQLASNYNSLQAISLEGNPAQKNVGDEQLKKYLQGLLPHLTYFNRQSIKAGTLKDSADRSARLGISAHQSDRSLRSDLKTTRKGNHGVAAHKRQPSSIHGRRSPHSQHAVASQKPSRDKQVRSTSTGIKTNVRPSFIGSKLLSLRPDLAMQRSRSEGTLGGT
ncbi:Outer arm dynein light chain 1 protein [Heracleum sosnowskyi]|uniref:Outer arm dynein light chain 1 protein n=1 Tax=Heracleum sosnowskyi TaxID=360622 RepID=A0AAD8IR62_9APIA|nr:Outer arm dynein light chain 1 protein [Heracleum sosnowskyi]